MLALSAWAAALRRPALPATLAHRIIAYIHLLSVIYIGTTINILNQGASIASIKAVTVNVYVTLASKINVNIE